MTADLAIIGGGFVGACALRIAAEEHPEWRIVLLDRALAGQGATRYSVGMALPYGRNPWQRRLSMESMEIFARWAGEIPELRLRRIPLFAVIARGAADEVLAGFHGAPMRAATGDEERTLRASYPGLTLPAEHALFTGSWSTWTEPHRVVERIIAEARRGGSVECCESADVVQATRDGGAYALALGDGRSVRARRVIAAPGPWIRGGATAAFARQHGIRVKRVVALHIENAPPPDAPLLFFFDEDAFLLPLPERGRWLFSITSRHWDVSPEDPRTLVIDQADRELALSILRRYCAALVPYATGGRVFCDAYTPDWHPLIASVSDQPEFVVATGCAGSGYRLGPAMAKAAVSLLAASTEVAHAHANPGSE